jgi:hypothetical protein
MEKKKKEYKKPIIISEKVFEETALQCTVTGSSPMNTPMAGCACVWKIAPGGKKIVRS